MQRAERLTGEKRKQQRKSKRRQNKKPPPPKKTREKYGIPPRNGSILGENKVCTTDLADARRVDHDVTPSLALHSRALAGKNGDDGRRRSEPVRSMYSDRTYGNSCKADEDSDSENRVGGVSTCVG